MKQTLFTAGGDLRQIYASNKLAGRFNVQITGFEKDVFISESIRYIDFDDMSQCFADYLLLPMPVSADGIILNAPYSKNSISLSSIISTVKKGGIIFGGKIDSKSRDFFEKSGFETIDYLEREEFSVLNAVPTAEGAVQIALEEMPTTLSGSEVLITGHGRITKVLIKILKAMGCKITVAARKYSDLAWAEVFGCRIIHIYEIQKTISDMSLVINTVPAMVLDKSILERADPDCLIIDLASKPGGVDFSAAAKLGIKVIWALGLPGKTAPVTSGEIIADTVINILSERGLLYE